MLLCNQFNCMKTNASVVTIIRTIEEYENVCVLVRGCLCLIDRYELEKE